MGLVVSRQVPWVFVMQPGQIHHICIMPYRSYVTLEPTMRALNAGDWAYDRLQWRSEARDSRVSFSDLLALFAVHRRDLGRALLSLITAGLKGTTYENPSNGLRFRAWDVPMPQNSFRRLLLIKEAGQALSEETVRRLLEFFERRLKGNFRLLFNPVKPLISDFVLWDEKNEVKYLIEHKSERRGL